MQAKPLCRFCGGSAFLLNGNCRDCGTKPGYIAGEPLRPGPVYIRSDGKVYNSPEPKHNED